MGGGFGEGYFKEHILFHTHIAKSAGTSIVDALTHILGLASVFDTNSSPDADAAVSSLGPNRKRLLKLLSGHFWYGTQDRYFERRPVYLATVRDPIERFGSLFNFVLSGDRHPLFREFDIRGLDGSARWYFVENPKLANEMTNTLGVPPDASPIEWVERRYAIVAPMERADLLVAKLYEIFAPDAEPRVWRSNATQLSRSAIGADVIQECRAAATRDQLLCRQVSERFDEWLYNLRTRLETVGQP